MDSSFLIKDKEAKIYKIIKIINDIGNTLEKVLVFAPYSPRTLENMKQKKEDEERQDLEKRTKMAEEDLGRNRPMSVHPNDPYGNLDPNQSFTMS
mmetsp:Transcript_35559/g.34590  ORF Transcript_35559/g.34590 Transcript_35559/m.34590 type:complete len:95 (-) Transcript_35559:1608-1892(-)